MANASPSSPPPTIGECHQHPGRGGCHCCWGGMAPLCLLPSLCAPSASPQLGPRVSPVPRCPKVSPVPITGVSPCLGIPVWDVALVSLHHTSVSSSVPEPQCPCTRGSTSVSPRVSEPWLSLSFAVCVWSCTSMSPSVPVPGGPQASVSPWGGGACFHVPKHPCPPLPATRWAIRAPTFTCEAATCALTSTSSQQW